MINPCLIHLHAISLVSLTKEMINPCPIYLHVISLVLRGRITMT